MPNEQNIQNAPLFKDSDIPDWVPEEVRAELLDPQYSHRAHYNHRTYAQGCRGTLCTLLNSQRHRAIYERTMRKKGKVPAGHLGRAFWEKAMLPVVEWYKKACKDAIQRRELEEFLQQVM